MTKDIIYIDVEDDITAIIGKIKKSHEKVVALVPPKRIGILQSAVNLQLLSRIAKNTNKKLVLITHNHALMALSSSAGIPVAKNLKTKPMLLDVKKDEEVEGEDVIDGAQLPVGDHVRIASAHHGKVSKKDESSEEATETEDSKDESEEDQDTVDNRELVLESIDIEKANEEGDKKSKKEHKIKVPDFGRFRIYLLLGLIFGSALIYFLVWAMVYAPAAKVIITAKTSPAPVSVNVKLSDTTDISKNTIQILTKELKKESSVEFNATGTDTVGDKASGTITLSNAFSSDAIYVPAGSSFNNGDYNFVTTADASVPGAGVVDSEIVAGTLDVAVEAEDIGGEYNLSERAYISSVGGLTAYGGDMTGGTSREVKVVTEDDLKKAKDQLASMSEDQAKEELIAQFTNGEAVIMDSFVANDKDPVVSSEVGKEAKGGIATVSSESTYVITAIAKSELDVYLKDAIEKQIDTKTQRIYDDGFEDISFSSYLKTEKATTVSLATVGKVGPNIDQDQVKDRAKGLRYGDVQALLGIIKGVSDVDVKFSYFWVTTVPEDTSKIEVEFILQND